MEVQTRSKYGIKSSINATSTKLLLKLLAKRQGLTQWYSRSTKDHSIPGTFTGTYEANYGNISTIKGKEFKHTAVKKDQKKCFTNVGLGIHYNYYT